MPSDLKDLCFKASNILNHLTITLFFIGLYLTLGQPHFFVGKSSFFSITILPFFSVTIFINSIFLLILNHKPQLIPKNDYKKSLLLFILTTTFFSIFKLPELTLVFFSILFFFYNIQISKPEKLKKTIYISTFAMSIIAISQFILQSDLNLQFLGEPIISSTTKGIAKLSGNLIRSYGLFQHPNILAAILVLSSFINPYKTLKNSFAPHLTALFTTFSLSGLLALSTKYIKSIKYFTLLSLLGLVLFIFLKSPDFLFERITQITNLFYNPYQPKPWELQPIHNTFILSFLNFSPLHLLSFSWLLFEIYKKNKNFFFAIFILLSFDHYFLTSFQAFPFFITTLMLLESTSSDPEMQTKTQ